MGSGGVPARLAEGMSQCDAPWQIPPHVGVAARFLRGWGVGPPANLGRWADGGRTGNGHAGCDALSVLDLPLA